MDEPFEPRGRGRPSATRAHFGKFRGQVVNNRDSRARGRLEVVVPALMGERALWAEPCLPYAGDGVGWFVMPPVGAQVWVEFEGGDLDHPIWTGCRWAGTDSVPGGGLDPEIRILKTEKVTVTIDDNRGRITIETRGGARLTLAATSADLKAVTTTAEGAVGKIVLSAAGADLNDGAFTVLP
ncbi:MAG: phage baseplate assembly protein V [Pseudomonadota bacterium]